MLYFYNLLSTYHNKLLQRDFLQNLKHRGKIFLHCELDRLFHYTTWSGFSTWIRLDPSSHFYISPKQFSKSLVCLCLCKLLTLNWDDDFESFWQMFLGVCEEDSTIKIILCLFFTSFSIFCRYISGFILVTYVICFMVVLIF